MVEEVEGTEATPEPGEGSTGTASGPSQEERTWALLAHILGLVASFIAPLVIWLVKKDESAFVGDQALEALNFQITVLLAFLACFLLSFVCVGFFLMPVVGVYALVMAILAALKANEGQRYRYPITLRLVR
jgi:uncharacterized protein